MPPPLRLGVGGPRANEPPSLARPGRLRRARPTGASAAASDPSRLAQSMVSPAPPRVRKRPSVSQPKVVISARAGPERPSNAERMIRIPNVRFTTIDADDLSFLLAP